MSKKPEYLSDDEFVVIWMRRALAGGTLSEVAAEIGEACRRAGTPPMPEASVASRASTLRKLGVRLPKLAVGVRTDADRLNALVDSVARGEAPPLPPPKRGGAGAAAPPQPLPLDPRPDIASIVDGLSTDEAVDAALTAGRTRSRKR